MSDLFLKKEVRRVAREYALPLTNKSVCSLARILKMQNKQIDTAQLCKIIKEISF